MEMANINTNRGMLCAGELCVTFHNLQIRQEVLTLKCNWNSLKICGALWDNYAYFLSILRKYA